MLVYKNSNFWIRLLANLIDIGITAGFIAGMYLLIIFKKEASSVTYIAFIVINIGYLILYFMIFPIMAFGSTLGQHITTLKMVSNDLNIIRNRDVLIRNALCAWYWILIFLVYLIFFGNDNIKQVINAKENERTLIQNLGIAFISTLSGNWFLLMFVNYAMILFSKKKLSLTDRTSKTRVVFKKQLYIIPEKEIFLVPRKIERRKITYYKNANKENKFYE